MKILVVVGGYGTRFWPASRRRNPKQHQRVVSHNKSLVQLKFAYLRQGFKPQDIFVVTGATYQNEIQRQLPKIPKENFIFEPEMRDTAPAVGLGVIKIAHQFPKEIISIQWSDHFLRDPQAFIKALKHGEEIAQGTGKDVVIGVPARFPTPHRGYIKIGNKIKSLNHRPSIVLCSFEKFVEKPSLAVAREYIASGDYLWNPGYFLVHPQRVLEKYEKFAPDIFKGLKAIQRTLGTKKEESLTKKVYQSWEKESFDYVYAEPLNPEEAMVIAAEMGWSDVGEWNSLKETLEESPEANVLKGLVRSLDCQDNLIYNYEEKKLVAALDLKRMVVVNTPDALLVCPQDSIGKIKKLLKSFEGTALEKYT
jgi:mannose-1-phosphate guanylyltransferase